MRPCGLVRNEHVIAAVERNKARFRDLRRDLAPPLEGDDAFAAAMDHQRRAADLRDAVANVGPVERPHHR